MKIKVCGMRDSENIRDLAKLPIDWMGFIFYRKSLRYAENLSEEVLRELPQRIKRVGVFVNASLNEILERAKAHKLNTVQLHGTETPDICRELKQCGLEVIKAFPIAEEQDFDVCNGYRDCCDYFLFDTKTVEYGGSGKQFDWRLLDFYTGNTPFLLSGGIDEECAEKINDISHKMLVAVDLNSRFEVAPGIKNDMRIKRFIEELKEK